MTRTTSETSKNGAGVTPAPSSTTSPSSSVASHPHPHPHPHDYNFPPPSQSVILDKAANPLTILALFEEATTGIVPKLVAGGLSCMLISALLNPMDVIKVRLQTQQVATPERPSKYQGFSHAFRTIYREEGYRRGLMRGFTPSMMREASYSSLRMGLYDMVKIMIAPPATSKDEFTLTQKIVAGCISGACGSVIATPTDLVKIRFQGYSLASPNPYPHSLAAFNDIYQKGGIRGLYTGGTPTIARAAILTGSQLSSYDHSKRMMLRSGFFDDNPRTHFIASVISGLVTTTMTNPVDVIKTRIMNDSTKTLYSNPIDCVIKTLRYEGPLAFMKGWVPNYLRLGPHFILSLPLAEYIRVSLGADSL